MRWAATAVTLFRAVLGPVVAALIVWDHGWAAFWLFLVAIASDLVDGWAARRWGSPEGLGDWLDPVCDKVLTDCVWAALWFVQWAPTWLVLLSVARDWIVVLGWCIARWRGHRWKSTPIAQVAVAYQGTAIAILVFHGPWLGVDWPSVGTILGCMGLALSAFAPLSTAWALRRSVSERRAAG